MKAMAMTFRWLTVWSLVSAAFVWKEVHGVASWSPPPAGSYLLGVGIADMTGPAAEINMMGYAKFGQDTAGIHLRQFSRAFIFDDGHKRVVFVSCDIGMTTQLVKLEVLKKLNQKYGTIYTADNVCISSTHTHAGPGGFFQYFLYLIPSLGFIRQTMDAYVTGIVRSIERAHESVQPGYVFWNEGELRNASINRSPSSYLFNPPEERALYEDDTDKSMFLLKLTDLNGNPLGSINWFAVHGTSMNSTNQLISSDNKGYASLLFEREINGPQIPLGKGPFVAAFAQANEGDVSPNILGPHCIDTGLPCDLVTSTCNGDSTKCIAFGPGKDMYESTKIIAERQFAKAKELFDGAFNKLKGPLSFAHQYVDMTNVTVRLNDTATGKTCKSALGYSFAAGTTDGPGLSPFHQSQNETNPIWNFVRDFIKTPSEELVKCQHPKPILAATGEINVPYQWTASIVPTQVLLLGSLAIAAVPGEFTTMSGRRVKSIIKETMARHGKDVHVVVAGLSNTYTNYIATYEEYQAQRYEAASTLFGPHTLQAYLTQYGKLAEALATSRGHLPPGPLPPNLLSEQISLKPGVIFDSHPLFESFGSLVTDVRSFYKRKSTVRATFISANPRNNLQLEETFLTVERYNSSSGQWEVIATDADWETKYEWFRPHVLEPALSYATISWTIPDDALPGKYRLRHFGHARSLFQTISPFAGTSGVFQIL